MADSNKVTLGSAQNVEATITGNTLLIKVDLSKDFGQNLSGKTIRVATVGKPCQVPGTDVFIGLNAFKYPHDSINTTASRPPILTAYLLTI